MSSIIPKGQLTAFQRWEMASFNEERKVAPVVLEVVEPAPPPPPQLTEEEIEEIKLAAHKEAYATGYQEGYEKGVEEGNEKGYEETISEMNIKIEALNTIVESALLN